MATYGTPLPGHGNVIAGIYCRSPHQARILQKLLEASMKEYAGRPEEGLLAVWHQEVCSILDRARRNNWQGWEDTNPIWRAKDDH